jgi:transcriptional regulator with XRE-family HTH domain
MTAKNKAQLLTEIGNRIRLKREEKNLSQQDLAALCNFEKTNMSRLEAGRTNPTISTLFKISQALGIKLIDLLDVE